MINEMAILIWLVIAALAVIAIYADSHQVVHNTNKRWRKYYVREYANS